MGAEFLVGAGELETELAIGELETELETELAIGEATATDEATAEDKLTEAAEVPVWREGGRVS